MYFSLDLSCQFQYRPNTRASFLEIKLEFEIDLFVQSVDSRMWNLVMLIMIKV